MTAAAWCALVMALVAWGLLRTTDQHWAGTLVAFGPRWLMLVVVGVLAFLAVCWRRRALVPLAVAGTLISGPVMGLCVPIPNWGNGNAEGGSLRVLTCNTLAGRADAGLSELVAAEHPDVVTLQEWPAEGPLPQFVGQGWNIVREGGLVVACRHPIAKIDLCHSPLRWHRLLGVRCAVETPGGTVDLYALHLTTPRKGLESVLRSGWGGLADLQQIMLLRQEEGAAVKAWLSSGRLNAASSGPTVIVGDFNMTVESVIYRDAFSGFQNAFSTAGWGWGGTKFTRRHSVRIDHILASSQWRIVRCEVGKDVGSDHRPVIADLVLP